MKHFFSLLMLIIPVAIFFWLIYRHNYRGRKSISAWKKVRGMGFYIGLLIGGPLLLLLVFWIFNWDACAYQGLYRWRNCS